MSIKQELFEFICTMSKQQIAKYLCLGRTEMGPDARLHATLCLHEVDELLEFAQQLQTDKTDQSVISILNQVMFYAEQEYIRIYAAWLLDANPVHCTLFERTENQVLALQNLRDKGNIPKLAEYFPNTHTQLQCQQDTYRTAFCILEMAIKIKANPNMVFDELIPEHAQNILKRNAMTRYCESSIIKPIRHLFTACEEFLMQSQLPKLDSTLDKQTAEAKAAEHNNKLAEICQKGIQNKLVLVRHEEFTKPRPVNHKNNQFGFFAPAALGGLIVYLLIAAFNSRANDNYSNEYSNDFSC